MISWPLAVVFAVGVVMAALSPVLGAAIVAGCILLALTGPAGALQALAIATLVTFGSSTIFTPSAVTGILVRFVLVAAIVRVLPLVRARDLGLIWPVWLLTALAALTSAAVSPALGVSLVKVITFGLATTTLLVAVNRLAPQRLRSLQTWFLTLGVTIIALSALTLAKPGLGIGPNGGLQGLLAQPQAMGIFLAPFAAWSLTGLLLMRKRTSWLEAVFALGCMVLIFLTRVLIALGVVLLLRMFSHRAGSQANLGRPMAIAAVLALVLIAAPFASDKVSGLMRAFAFKGTEKHNRDLGEAFYDSRGGGLLGQWYNFQTSPIIGHGFGVYPDGHFPAGVVEFYGIPISAPIEKGFLPTAILEECGIVGGVSLITLILWLGRYAWRCSDLRWRAMFVAALGVNVGECVFLAPGGLGMIHWICLALAVSAYRAERVAPAVRRGAPEPQATIPEPENAAVVEPGHVAAST
jgi:hypothetical protein